MKETRILVRPTKSEKITKVPRRTYSIEPTPQDAGEISGPSKCMCNSSSSHLRSINSFDIIDSSSYQIWQFVAFQNITYIIAAERRTCQERNEESRESNIT